ncbi:MAG TPA: hypothetical protein VJ697_14945, partial [Nitrososphaeraceae archaeon]|nr:hypothetical protein [Nitrososphaeraceae archaeon]
MAIYQFNYFCRYNKIRKLLFYNELTILDLNKEKKFLIDYLLKEEINTVSLTIPTNLSINIGF